MPIREASAGSDPTETLALGALAWILSDDNRAERFVALTGIAPQDLRARADDPAVLDAALGFLEGHEPDLMACATSLGVSPSGLIAARARLGGGVPQ